jgi:prepilin-type N-terminal cleavage/methylation domain-containing protein
MRTRLAARCRSERGVTLVEVLVAIMLAGIGLLALLTLFPLGALSMAQAIKDDRDSRLHDVAHDLTIASTQLEVSLNHLTGLYTQWVQQQRAEPKALELADLMLQIQDDELARIAQKVRLRLPDLGETDRQLAKDVVRLLRHGRAMIAAVRRNLAVIENLQRALDHR